MNVAEAKRRAEVLPVASLDADRRRALEALLCRPRAMTNVIPMPTRRVAPNDLTDSAHAEAIAHTRSRELRFVTSWNCWITWDGTRWSKDLGREVAERAPKRIADEIMDCAKDAPPKEAAALAGAAMKLRGRKGREAAVALARWEPELALHHDRLDRDADHLLVTPGGTVDLRTGDVTANDPARLLTRTTSTPYDSGAACPTWERFISEISGNDAELPAYLQRAVGYSLTGSIAEHIFFFLYGAGANGKTTLVETLRRYVFGDYAHPLRSEALMAADHAQHPTVWASLCGVRLAVASEIEKGSRFSESLVKSITGGDVISCRRMREDFWTFSPSFKLWILGNDKPVVRGTDEGIWRRLRLIPFAVSFLGREDRELPNRLRAEAPGILRWAVDGAREWYAEGLREPGTVRAATDTYRREQDVFGLWVADALEVAPLRSATAKELRDSYKGWADANGAHPVGAREFADRLRELGADDDRGNRGRFWRGVGLVRRES